MLDMRYVIREKHPPVGMLGPFVIQEGGRYPLRMVEQSRHIAEINRQRRYAARYQHLARRPPVIPFVHSPYTYRKQEPEGHIPLHLPCPRGMVCRP